MDLVIPTMGWEQIGGDMSPGAYGGTLATADGSSIELLKIQPVREYVGDSEAKEVGFPFWTREASFTLDDLDPSKKDVRSALDSIGMTVETLETDYDSPTTRALIIAEALLDYGCADEGPAGWSSDIVPGPVKWWNDKVAGAEYLADEDDEFRREILLGDLDVDYEKLNVDDGNGLKITTNVCAWNVEISEWTDIEAANGQEQPDGEKIVRRDATVGLDELFATDGKHRGSYSGDNRAIGIVQLSEMTDDEDREKAIVAAAIAYLVYFGGDESFVDEIGE